MIAHLTNEQMNAFLESHSIGNLGCFLGQRAYVFPMTYVFHDDVIYGQTTSGKKVEAARRTPLVCFTVHETQDEGWKSIMCWGKFEELNFADLEPGTETAVIKLLTSKIGSIQNRLGIEVPFQQNGAMAPVVIEEKEATLFRIAVVEKTGRQWNHSKKDELP